jgi:hypothetical protein
MIVDIFPHARPVSQRDPLQAIRITEEDLIRPVQDLGNTSEREGSRTSV